MIITHLLELLNLNNSNYFKFIRFFEGFLKLKLSKMVFKKI